MDDFAQRFYARISECIERTGRMVLGVGAVPTFSYSIGNHTRGLPELLIIGLSPNVALTLINRISDVGDLDNVKDGEIINTTGPLGLKAIRCGWRAKEEYTVQASRYFGHDDYGLLQLLVPDTQGRYPGELGCDPPYRDIPVLRTEA
jgi:hypothetical protein